MVIRTKSGETFIMSVSDNGLRIQRGIGEGRVASLSGLTVGECLTIRYFPFDIYCQTESDSESVIITTPITEILP